MRTLTLALVLAAAAGCRNPCQSICARMAKVAEEDCGITVPDAELDLCLEAQAEIEDREERQACNEFGSVEAIRDTWTCEDLRAYWAGAPAEGA